MRGQGVTLRTNDRAYCFDANEIVREDRDRWVRLFNRLEASISHHKKATADFSTDADEALYAARDRILRDAAS